MGGAGGTGIIIQWLLGSNKTSGRLNERQSLTLASGVLVQCVRDGAVEVPVGGEGEGEGDSVYNAHVIYDQ